MLVAMPLMNRNPWWSLCLLTLLLGGAAEGFDVVVRAPLTTLVPCLNRAAPGMQLAVTLTVPLCAPGDLGVGVYVSDRHGRWFQRAWPGSLRAGRHELVMRLDDAGFLGEPERGTWSAPQQAVLIKAGLYLWTATPGHLVVQVENLRLHAAPLVTVPPIKSRLTELIPGPPRLRTGERWAMSLVPEPLPINPYDPELFSLDAVITLPEGGHVRIPGFFHEPMRRSDRGDRDISTPAGSGHFAVRFRPRQPGLHRISLEARWKNAAPVTIELPPFTAEGPAWDGYVRVDAEDPRFLSRAGAFVWPLGPNLRSVNDSRSAECLKTLLTPDRGMLAYDAYLPRLAAHGVTGIEVWMSSWNLALEWRADWPPYQGLGRYSQEHAADLDHLLDQAERLGVGVVLVLDNHGKVSLKCDIQWQDNPYNKECGGPLGDPATFFTDAWALAQQAKLRRYLVARYADSPALLMWKLWSEVSLTNGESATLRAWHQQAGEHLRGLDSYRHPVTTHWHQDYHIVDRTIAALPEIDVIAIDAYHGSERALADLLVRGLHDQILNRGLAIFNKPVIITEYGAQWNAGAQPQMEAEHAVGPWVGLMSGYGAAPMLWWFEWIDQGERFSIYDTLTRYLVGEDLRGADAASAALVASSPDGALWSRAWVRPSRMLGYLVDASWGQRGGTAAEHRSARLKAGSAVSAGKIHVAWWNADDGTIISSADLTHPGGELFLTVPAFHRHIAFKLWRMP